MIFSGLFRFLLFLLYRLYKDDNLLIELSKKMKRSSAGPQDPRLISVFKVLRKLATLLPIENKCFVLSLTMFSLCGEGAQLFFGMTPKESQPLCHSWVKWQTVEFNSDYSFQGNILWTHSK